MFTLEFVKDLLERLADHIAKDVHATTMGHTKNNLGYTMLNEFIKGNLKSRNKRFTTFNTKTLGGIEFVG
jgi:hypothetical protein